MWPDARAVRPYNDKKANLLLLGKRLAFFACADFTDYRTFINDLKKITCFLDWYNDRKV